MKLSPSTKKVGELNILSFSLSLKKGNYIVFDFHVACNFSFLSVLMAWARGKVPLPCLTPAHTASILISDAWFYSCDF